LSFANGYQPTAKSYSACPKKKQKKTPANKTARFGVEYVLSCCATVVHCSRALFGKQLI